MWVKNPGKKGWQLHVGIYGSLQHAAKAYDFVARNLRGDQAVTNSELSEAQKAQLDQVMTTCLLTCHLLGVSTAYTHTPCCAVWHPTQLAC